MENAPHRSGEASTAPVRSHRSAVFPSLIALVTLFAAVAVPVAIDDVPWWTVAALALAGVLTAVNAVVA